MPRVLNGSITGWVAPDLAAAIPKLPDFDSLSQETLPQFRALLRGEPPDLTATPDLRVEWIGFPGFGHAQPPLNRAFSTFAPAGALHGE